MISRGSGWTKASAALAYTREPHAVLNVRSIID